MLDYICQLLEQMAVLEVLPNDLEQREFVINRALDVRSAAMLYLATHIRDEATAFGIPGTPQSKAVSNIAGKIVKVFFAGGEQITDSKVYLQTCVDNYSRALTNVVGIRVLIEVREMLKGNLMDTFLS